MTERLPDWIPPRLAFWVLVIVGIGLVVNPVVPGIHVGDGSVHRYEAAQVTYDSTSGLQAVDVSGGEAPAGLEIDDDVVCERGADLARVCTFERAVLDGANLTAPRPDSVGTRYRYVYLNDTLYEPTVERRDGELYVALESETGADPLENIAHDGDLPGPVRAAISGDRVLVHGELALENELVRYDDAYYTIYGSGVKHYGSTGSFCASRGEGFCTEADWKRRVDTLLTLGSRLLGSVLLVGAYRLRWKERPT